MNYNKITLEKKNKQKEKQSKDKNEKKIPG